MYNENKRSKSSIVDFRKAPINYLTRPADSQEIIINERLNERIKLKEVKVRDTRRFCVQCYKDSVQEFGRKVAKNKAKKVSTYCVQCKGEPHFCLKCFNYVHR